MFSPAENQETLGASVSKYKFSGFFFFPSSPIPVEAEEGILLTYWFWLRSIITFQIFMGYISLSAFIFWFRSFIPCAYTSILFVLLSS